jgi:hypothetical protein
LNFWLAKVDETHIFIIESFKTKATHEGSKEEKTIAMLKHCSFPQLLTNVKSFGLDFMINRQILKLDIF